jgi:GR25 family glycosyltransferase involved in LPS biosynthesis
MTIDNARLENINNIKSLLSEINFCDDIQYINGRDVDARALISSLGIKTYGRWIVRGERVRRGQFPGEWGIWASYINIWQYMVSNNIKNVLVLEDDCVIDESFLPTLQSILKDIPEDYDFTTLKLTEGYQETKNLKTDSSSMIGSKFIQKAIHVHNGTMSMLFSLSGAKKLLELTKRKGIHSPVDDFIYEYNSAGLLNGYSILPSLNNLIINGDDIGMNSVIRPRSITDEYAMFIVGNGRKGYLERTIASWEANLVGQPKAKIIFDDSGDHEYVAWLNKKYGKSYTVVPIPNAPAGHAKVMQFIFEYLKSLPISFFLQLEEDWMLFRPIDIQKIISVLKSNKHIIQMRIPRTIWHSEYHDLDIKAGSLLAHHIGMKNTKTRIKDGWYEWRGDYYFWSHNPNVFHKDILQFDYDNVNRHEYEFGLKVFKGSHSNYCGWWASNIYDGYVTHIGIRDEKLLREIS